MGPTRFWTWVALVLSGAASAVSVYLSVGMDLVACPLCFYQRAFVMGVFGVLAMAVLSGAQSRVAPAVLAMPAALAGLFIAGYHTYLVASGKLECPDGLFNLGAVPYQSFAIFILIVLALARDTGAFVLQKEAATGQSLPPPGRILAVAVGPLVLAGLFAFGCIRGTPPPLIPSTDYHPGPIKTCRVPYKAP